MKKKAPRATERTLPPLHLACTGDDLRPAMRHILIEGGVATATDAHIIVRYDLRDILEPEVLEALEGKLISVAQWKLMMQQSKTFLIMGVTPEKEVYIQLPIGRVTLSFDNSLKYPYYNEIWNNAMSREFAAPKLAVGFNYKYVEVLGKILGHGTSGTNTLQMYFQKNLNGPPENDALENHKALFVVHPGNTYAAAILMPVMLSEIQTLSHLTAVITKPAEQ